MKCDRGLLSDYRDGELSPQRKRALEEHLGVCDECRKTLRDYEGIARAIRALPRYEASDVLAKDVYAGIKAERQGITSRFGREGLPRFGALAAVTLIVILAAATTLRNAPSLPTGLQAGAPAPIRTQDRDVSGPAPIQFQDRDVSGPAPIRTQDREVAGQAQVRILDRESSGQVAQVSTVKEPERTNPPVVIASQPAPVGRDRQVAEAALPMAVAASTPPSHEPVGAGPRTGNEVVAEGPKAIAAQAPAAGPQGSPIPLASPVALNPVLSPDKTGPAQAVAVSTPEPGRVVVQVPAVATLESTVALVPRTLEPPVFTPTLRLFSIVAGVEITTGTPTTATMPVTRGLVITSTVESAR